MTLPLLPTVSEPVNASKETRETFQRLRAYVQKSRHLLNSLILNGDLEQTGDGWRIVHPDTVSGGGSLAGLLSGHRGQRIHFGAGEPAKALGAPGDVYIDEAYDRLYHKAAALPLAPARWVEKVSFAGPGPAGARGKRGPKGDPGQPGRNGTDGTNGTSVVNGAQLERSTGFSVANTTDTVVEWSTLIRDDGSMTTGGAPYDRLIAASTGWHFITVSIRYQASGAGYRACWLLKNGSFTTGPVGVSGNATTVNDVSLQASLCTYLAATDYIQVNAYQDSGGALNITGGTFSMVKL